jgi:hypothetical protein
VIDMNRDDLKIKNDMLAKISALKASIEALKITDGKEYKELLKSNEKILEDVEAEYKLFIDRAEKDRVAEIKRKQEEGQKIIKDDIVFVGKYLSHVAKLKLGERPSEEMLQGFNARRRKAHVITHLRNMKLKGL